MARNNKYTAQQMIEAIQNSGGIKAVVARRLGCDWRTVDNYIKRYSTVAAAYENEQEQVVDLAESILVSNMQLARKKQIDGNVMVDTADAKWVLSMKGSERGYAQKQKVEHTGEGVVIRIVYDESDKAEDGTRGTSETAPPEAA